MTNAKHTPGPWSLEAGRSISTSSGSFYLSYGKDKASGAPLFSNFCELDANARLIAAAPDLLAALELCFQYVNGGDNLRPGLQHEAFEAARAAIAKATNKEV